MNNDTTVQRCHLAYCDTHLDTAIFLTALCCFILWFVFTLRWLIKNRDLLAMIADPRAYLQSRNSKINTDNSSDVVDKDNISLSEFEIDFEIEKDNSVLKLSKK